MNQIDRLENYLENHCPVTACLQILGGKWKPLILFFITNGVDRFGALQRKIPDVSKQMLTKQLRELEEAGVIHRQVFAEVPPRVQYTVTTKGQSLYPIIDAMRKWGEKHLAGQNIPTV